MTRPLLTEPLFNNDRLITAEGRIDFVWIKCDAKARANSQYGVDVTPDDVAFWEQKLIGLAEVLADKFRRDGAAKIGRAA